MRMKHLSGSLYQQKQEAMRLIVVLASATSWVQALRMIKKRRLNALLGQPKKEMKMDFRASVTVT